MPTTKQLRGKGHRNPRQRFGTSAGGAFMPDVVPKRAKRIATIGSPFSGRLFSTAGWLVKLPLQHGGSAPCVIGACVTNES
jgi:hypothetical protein